MAELLAFTTLVPIAGAVFVFMLVVYVAIRMRYKKAGPDEALIVYGRKKILGPKVRSEKGEVEAFRIIHGGARSWHHCVSACRMQASIGSGANGSLANTKRTSVSISSLDNPRQGSPAASQRRPTTVTQFRQVAGVSQSSSGMASTGRNSSRSFRWESWLNGRYRTAVVARLENTIRPITTLTSGNPRSC